MVSRDLLKVSDLKKYFAAGKGLYYKALDGIGFSLQEGEILGLVGESGCGKTTTARTILRLIEPTSGQIEFEGQNLLGLNKMEMKKMRRYMQIIYQDPYSSLNPRMKIGEIIGEPMEIHPIFNKHEKKDRIDFLLEKVGLKIEDKNRYPHEFSGGQRQRISIARALALNPKLIIGDEPVSALDLSIRSQILNLLTELHQEYCLTYILISHDFSVISYLCDKVAVMYLGKIVEWGPAYILCQNPEHPYTQILISSIPSTNPDIKKERILLEGDIPSPHTPPLGCRFHPRCFRKMSICEEEEPPTITIQSGHYVTCHLYG